MVSADGMTHAAAEGAVTAGMDGPYSFQGH